MFITPEAEEAICLLIEAMAAGRGLLCLDRDGVISPIHMTRGSKGPLLQTLLAIERFAQTENLLAFLSGRTSDGLAGQFANYPRASAKASFIGAYGQTWIDNGALWPDSGKQFLHERSRASAGSMAEVIRKIKPVIESELSDDFRLKNVTAECKELSGIPLTYRVSWMNLIRECQNFKIKLNNDEQMAYRQLRHDVRSAVLSANVKEAFSVSRGKGHMFADPESFELFSQKMRQVLHVEEIVREAFLVSHGETSGMTNPGSSEIFPRGVNKGVGFVDYLNRLKDRGVVPDAIMYAGDEMADVYAFDALKKWGQDNGIAVVRVVVNGIRPILRSHPDVDVVLGSAYELPYVLEALTTGSLLQHPLRLSTQDVTRRILHEYGWNRHWTLDPMRPSRSSTFDEMAVALDGMFYVQTGGPELQKAGPRSTTQWTFAG